MGRGSTNKRHQPTSVEKLSQTDAKPPSASEEAGLDIHSIKICHGFSGYNDEEKTLNIHFPPRCMRPSPFWDINPLNTELNPICQ